MKIAFASCMCAQVFPNQPVWNQIAEKNPDYLVLLGDSMYLDIEAPLHPQDMMDDEFSQHVFHRYRSQIDQPQFKSLVQSMPLGRVFSIWDDHDFLWNDACGAQLIPIQKEKIRISTAFQRVFRENLANGLSTFPDVYNDPRVWDLNEPPLATPSIELSGNCYLHLADVRTFRTETWFISENKKTILGVNQRNKFDASIGAHPDALHLFASGTTISGWKPYANDLTWLRNQAKDKRIVVLSGDVHRNERDYFPPLGKGWGFHEFTSSGAAVRDGVIIGKEQQNFGLVQIEGGKVMAKFYNKGSEQKKLSIEIDLNAWS